MGRTTTSKKDIPQEENYDLMPENKADDTMTQEFFEQPLNLEQQVTVRSIAGWTTGFSRMLTVGDVTIPSRGSIRLSRNEIISQVHNNNGLFNGIDGRGSHATLIIDDKSTLKEVDFITDLQFSDNKVKKIFEIQNQDTFEDEIKKQIVTRAEKYALMVSIVKQKLNDFAKIRFCEKYTGYKIDKVEQDEQNIR